MRRDRPTAYEWSVDDDCCADASLNPRPGLCRILGTLSVLLCIAFSGIAPLTYAELQNQQSGEGYRPTIDEDGDLVEPPDWVKDHQENDQVQDSSGGASSKVTIRGSVFYNDRRQHGLFSSRKTPQGAPGRRCGIDGIRDGGVDCARNWLAGQYMVVDVYERDQGYIAATAWNCKHKDLIASAVVSADGSFEASFDYRDDCRTDQLKSMALVVKVRLRFCGQWCFSVNDRRKNRPYVLDHPTATKDNPVHAKAGDSIELPRFNFNPAGTRAEQASDVAIAANYYASLVDTILTVHRDAGIPFYKGRFGEVFVLYPSNRTGSATALSPEEIAIIDKNNWVKGEVVAHEYGHILNQRAWDGDYGWGGVGNSGIDWNATTPAMARIAFKEGWANFLSRAVFRETMAAADPEFDDNTNKPPMPVAPHGFEVPRNVNKFLADWFDDRDDIGGGDNFAASSLYSVWYNLRKMYLDRLAYGGNYSAGLTTCDYINYYLNVRKSSGIAGHEMHAQYVRAVNDLVALNNINCQ